MKKWKELNKMIKKNGGGLRAAIVKKGTIYGDPNRALLVCFPEQGNFREMVFQFNGPDATIKDVSGPRNIIKMLRELQNGGKVPLTNGKIRTW
jgi:hypothetical protein